MLIMVCLGVGLFDTLSASWIGVSISSTRLGKFSIIIFSHRFSISHSLSSPSSIPMIRMSIHLRLSQMLLTLSSSFLNYFYFCCSDWVFSASLSFNSLICSSASCPPLLIPWNVFFMSDCFFFMFSVCFYVSYLFVYVLSSSTLPLNPWSILITSVLNSAPGRLLVSILFSSFSGPFAEMGKMGWEGWIQVLLLLLRKPRADLLSSKS